MTATLAQSPALLHPDDEADLFAADLSATVVILCWFCEPADQPEVPDGADYTFAVCRRCQKAAGVR